MATTTGTTGKSRLRPGSSTCECGACGLRFSGIRAFDRHRTGDQDHRTCLTETDLRVLGMVVNSRGHWAYPPSDRKPWKTKGQHDAAH